MVIAILADERLKGDFLSREFPTDIEFVWADSLRSLLIIEAEAYIDLLFELDSSRISNLKKLLPKPVIVNAVAYTSKDIGAPFGRINAWPTMLKRHIAEIAVPAGKEGESVVSVFASLGWPVQQVPDITGMVTPRIVASIINEAWYTFGEGVASRDDIDTAMKLGTNYPFGPFEWGEQIGLDIVVQLLREMQRTDDRYTIAPALLKETEANGADPKH